jgi:hypothetical protein
MAKEEERKVKTKGISSSKYVSSDNNDDSARFPNGLNEKELSKNREWIGSSGSTSWGSRGFAWARKKNTSELKRLLKLQTDENEEFAQGK